MEPFTAKNAEIIVKPPRISFLTDRIPPPAPLYIDGQDELQILINANAPSEYLLQTRLLRPDGSILTHSETLRNLTSNYANNNVTIRLTEGFLLSVTLTSNSGETQPGTVWASAIINKDQFNPNTARQVLFQGHLTTRRALTWPNGPMEAPTDGAGFLDVISSADPAAGAEVNVVLSTTTICEIISASAQLVTDATAATRTVSWATDDGTNIYGQYVEPAGQIASLTCQHSFGQGCGPASLANVVFHTAAPVGLRVPAFHRLRTITNGLQAGDNWGVCRILVKRWPQA